MKSGARRDVTDEQRSRPSPFSRQPSEAVSARTAPIVHRQVPSKGALRFFSVGPSAAQGSFFKINYIIKIKIKIYKKKILIKIPLN